MVNILCYIGPVYNRTLLPISYIYIRVKGLLFPETTDTLLRPHPCLTSFMSQISLVTFSDQMLVVRLVQLPLKQDECQTIHIID